jgi:hypothetical protein
MGAEFYAGRHEKANSRYSQFSESAYERTIHRCGQEDNVLSNLKDIV